MKLKEQLIGALDSIFLAVVAVWTITIAVALIQPGDAIERNGVVEIYSLTPVPASLGV